MSETPSPLEARMDEFKKETRLIIEAIADTYENSPVFDNTVLPLEPFMLMQTYEMLEGEESVKSAAWTEDDPRHFHELTAVEQGILVGTTCEMFGTTVKEMQNNEVDSSEIVVGNPDMIEEDAVAAAGEQDPSLALEEEHYYKTGVEGVYMSKYTYADKSIVWGVVKSPAMD